MVHIVRLLIVYLLFHGMAMAGAWGQLSGKNALGHVVTITDETRSGSPAVVVSGREGDIEYPFRGACSFNLEDAAFQPPAKFSCSPKGASPLAGTAFEQVGKTGKCRVMRFRCVAGCDHKQVPATLVYQPWEC